MLNKMYEKYSLGILYHHCFLKMFEIIIKAGVKFYFTRCRAEPGFAPVGCYILFEETHNLVITVVFYA